jgi:hypothetical protein
MTTLTVNILNPQVNRIFEDLETVGLIELPDKKQEKYRAKGLSKIIRSALIRGSLVKLIRKLTEKSLSLVMLFLR